MTAIATRPRLLDLFCKAGGAAYGYHLAGFDVVGVDHEPQKHYPFSFVQADALEYCAAHGAEFDAIHASPPCQAYSEATPLAYRGNHPDLIDPTRAALVATGKPYAIENVAGARYKLRDTVMLCGTMFGLPIWRHRWFEMWPAGLWLLPPCQHTHRPIVIRPGIAARANREHETWEPVRITGGARRIVMTPVLVTDHGGPNANGPGRMRPRTPIAVKRWAMEIDWMTEAELTEAIPPAYTEWVGGQLLLALASERAATAS